MKSFARVLLLACLAYPLSALAIFDDCLEYFPRGEIPSLTQVGRDLCFDGFAVYYSPSDKKPIYVVEKLNRERLTKPKQARTNLFYEEARLPVSERASLSDYRGSGYDRGHNAPAGDMGDERFPWPNLSLWPI